MTAAEYLAFEERAGARHEFRAGVVTPVPGCDIGHSFVNENLVVAVGSRLRHTACRTASRSLRLLVGPTGLYTYPDLMVLCGPPEFDPLDRNTVVNPTVVLEVLSPSTAAYDRGPKFRQYQRIPSVREIVLVAQDEPVVEAFARQPDGRWLLSTFEGPEAVFELTSVPVRVPLADVFRGVTFPPAVPPSAG